MKKELKQLEYGDKVKLKFVQPDIICSGRKRIEGYFKGTVISRENETTLVIRFNKEIGGKDKGYFHIATGNFYHKVHQDLVITKVIKAQ